jgi:hypothetical protein
MLAPCAIKAQAEAIYSWNSRHYAQCGHGCLVQEESGATVERAGAFSRLWAANLAGNRWQRKSSCRRMSLDTWPRRHRLVELPSRGELPGYCCGKHRRCHGCAWQPDFNTYAARPSPDEGLPVYQRLVLRSRGIVGALHYNRAHHSHDRHRQEQNAARGPSGYSPAGRP